MRFPGTLSARIIFGFAALIITFGGISVSAVLTTDQLNRTIGVIRNGFLPLALETRDLADRESSVQDYLKNELADEPTPRRVQNRLKGMRARRDTMLTKLEATLAGLEGVPEAHQKSLDRTAEKLADIRRLIGEAAPLYEAVDQAPPIDKVVQAEDHGGFPLDKVQAAEAALVRLRRLEARITDRTQTLQRGQRLEVEERAGHLERGAGQMRFLTILWGATALLVGLLITIWVTVNLRPLRRLRDAARGDRRAATTGSGSRSAARARSPTSRASSTRWAAPSRSASASWCAPSGSPRSARWPR